MRKKKEEIRDIYRGSERDFEKDYTPQVASERLAERQRDLRRSQLAVLFLGGLGIVLAVALVFLVVHTLLNEQVLAEKSAVAAQHVLPEESLWVMDYQRVDSPEIEEAAGAKPVSLKWIKTAAHHVIAGQQALYLNDRESALDQFRKVVEIYPDIRGLRGAMGTLYRQNKEYRQAAESFEQSLKEEESFDVVNDLGLAYIDLQEYTKAESFLKRALDLRPANPACYKNLAVLYQKMKRDNDAIYYFEKYIDMQPGDLNVMQEYGLYLTRLQRWKEAADLLSKLTQEVTDVAPPYFLLAQAKVQDRRPDLAIAALKRGIQLVDPQLAMEWISREEFNPLRGSAEFRNLVDQLQSQTVSPKP